MFISITTPAKTLVEQECDFVLVHGATGEFAMLEDHIPIISTVAEGFVKFRHQGAETFVAVVGGVVDQKNNQVTIIAQAAAIAASREDAFAELSAINQALLDANRRMEQEFVFSESELKRSIKASKSGEFM
jgi:F-type H+-transporting ATPase subunit epsilon